MTKQPNKLIAFPLKAKAKRQMTRQEGQAALRKLKQFVKLFDELKATRACDDSDSYRSQVDKKLFGVLCIMIHNHGGFLTERQQEESIYATAVDPDSK